MATSEINKVLAALIDVARNQPLTSPTPGTTDIAGTVLKNTRINWDSLPSVSKDKASPSVVSRIFDILSRPNYAVAEGFRRATGENSGNPKGWLDFASGLGAGLSGDVDPNTPGAQKTTFSDVLEEQGVENKAAKGIGGFALDVLLDPTTYLGVGAVRGAAKSVAKTLGKEIGETTVTKSLPTLSITKAKKPKSREVIPGVATEADEDFKTAESLLDQIVSNDTVAVRKLHPKSRTYEPVTDPIDVSIAQKTASEYLRKLKTGTDKMFTPRQQGLLFTNLLRKTGIDPNKAAGMLVEAERVLAERGVGFKLWDGSTGRLSEVIDEIGGPVNLTPDLLKQISTGRVNNKKLLQAVETLRARSVVSDAPKIKGLLDDISKAIATTDEVMSPAAAKNVKTAIKVHKPELLLSPAGVDTANKFIKELIEQGEGHIQVALDKKVRTFHAAMLGDTRKLTEVTSTINKAKEEALGVKLTDLGGQSTLKTIAMAFSTAYKNKDLRPLALGSITSARSSAARRARELNRVLEGKTQPQIDNAWRAAQGYVPSNDPLAKYFRDNLERLFSSSGIKDEVESVATRSAMAMKDINEELAKMSNKWPALKNENIRFHGGQFTDPLTGKIRDYNGINWLNSWETWELKKPQEVLFGLQTAVETVVKKYALQDDIVGRFASKVPHGDFTHKVDLKRMKGYYFPKEIAEQVPIMFKTIEDMYQSKAPILKLYDKVMGSWKRGVTIYVPSHHIRNMMGDVWLSYMAGVKNPVRYQQAARILRSQRHRYEGAHIDELVGKGATQRATGRGNVILRKNGREITDDMIYVNAHNHGLLLSAKDVEDIFGDELFGKWKPLGGKANEIASKTSELREHYTNMAHYIDAISRSKKTKLDEIFEDAAREVRKWHPNGTDLTSTERNVFRRTIPFYSWTRKAIPLVAESILFQPGKVAILPKAMQGAQTSLGIETPGRHDPFPVDQAFPGWLREQGLGPLGLSGAGGLAGLIGGLGRTETQNVTGDPLDAYTVLGTHTNPLTDIISQFTPNPLEGLTQMTAPGLQNLFELGTNQQLPSGAPVTSDPLRYTAEQIPILAPLYRILNRPGAERGKDETPLQVGPADVNIEALLNTLFASGIVGTGPYIPQRRR